MTHILQIDASARPGLAGIHNHGSHSRTLSHQFISRWQQQRPQDTLTHRDIGLNPPSIINHAWIEAAFTQADNREARMQEALLESDQLVDELIAADILIIGTPLYNFGMPAALKAWVDQVIRLNRTVAIDESDSDDHYITMLSDRPRHAIILAARGGTEQSMGGEMEHMNYLERHMATALEFMGITRFHYVAIEGQEAGGEVLAASVAQALQQVDALVDALQQKLNSTTLHEPA